MTPCPPAMICAQTPPAIVRTLKAPRCPKGGWTTIDGRRVRWTVDCLRRGTK